LHRTSLGSVAAAAEWGGEEETVSAACRPVMMGWWTANCVTVIHI